MDVNLISQILITVVVPLATQAVKHIQAIPIQEGQTARIRTFVGVSMFVLTAANAYLNGHLDSVLSPDMIQVGLITGVSWLVAHFGYHAVKTVTQ